MRDTSLAIYCESIPTTFQNFNTTQTGGSSINNRNSMTRSPLYQTVF